MAMHMATKLKRWTLEELHSLPDDGNRYELIRGDLFVTPAPSPAHEAIVNALAEIIDPYVRIHALGKVFRPRAVIRIEDSETEPDLMVRRVPYPLPANWADMPRPTLVVEVLSETTRRRDHVDKRRLYVDATIPDYWIVDGDARRIVVVRPGFDDVSTNGLVRWHPESAADPLVLDAAELFRTALG